MTRKKADKKPAADKAAKPSEVMKMPGVKLVKATADAIRSAINEGDDITTTLRDRVAEAKLQGIHPSSIKRVEGWLNKAKASDRGLAAIATELAHLDFYRDVLGLTDLLAKQGQMFARPEAGEEPSDEVGEESRDLRATHMRRPEAQPDEPAPGEPIKH